MHEPCEVTLLSPLYRWGNAATHLQLQFGILLWTKVIFSPFQLSLLSQKPNNVAFLFGVSDFCLCTLLLPRSTTFTPAQHPPWQQLCLRWATESPAAIREVMSSHPAENLLRARGTWAHFPCLPLLSPEWPPMGPLCLGCTDQIVLHFSWFFHCPSRWQTLIFPTFIQQWMKWNFNVSWSPLALLIKPTIITREVCKLATPATQRDTPNLAQIIAGSCLLSGYFNHWWLMPVRAIPGFDVPQTQEKKGNLVGREGRGRGWEKELAEARCSSPKNIRLIHPFHCRCYCICWGH